MIGYISKILLFVFFAILVISGYYFSFAGHVESFDVTVFATKLFNLSGYGLYVILIAIFYSVYKTITLYIGGTVLRLSILQVILLGLLHLLLLCILFFVFTKSSATLGVYLCFKIIYYLLLPSYILLVAYSFGKTCLEKLKILDSTPAIVTFLFSILGGLIVFITLLSIASFFHMYNLYVFLIILIALSAVSYKNILSSFGYICTEKSIAIENHDFSESSNVFKKINLYLLSTEFLFIILTFVISINFINIVRPMPIGWDDLGVYMNYPNLIAQANSSLFLGGMHSWEMLTGIGFLFHSNVQAFFLNNVGGILTSILLFLILSDLLKNSKKTFLNIPLLCTTIFMSMPMVIFQQAKDMKLDIGLFAFSIGGIYLVYKVLEKIKSDETKNELIDLKKYGIIFILLGVIIGFTFSIKLTSLITISALLGVISYSRLGVAGFLGYFSIFISIFTKFHLWEKLNVSYPKEDLFFVNGVSGLTFIAGVLLLGLAYNKYKYISCKQVSIFVGSFLLGIFLALSPWLVKNVSQTSLYSTSTLEVDSILNGASEHFQLDLGTLYSEDELSQIHVKNETQARMDAEGTTKNEDLGRYFGYDKGINNYIKLPYNLTMQVNQGGEFTDITYIYLLLLPLMLLFLPYKNKVVSIGISIVVFLGSIIFLVVTPLALLKELGLAVTASDASFLMHTLGVAVFNISTWCIDIFKIIFLPLVDFFESIFTNTILPHGYGVLLLMIFTPIIFLIFTVKDKKYTHIFKLNLIFLSIYYFLWMIAAYGIVWYGISMYFGFLVIIATGLYYISNYEESDAANQITSRFIGSAIVFLCISVYFFNSTIPHGFNNLKNAGFNSFKTGGVSQVVGIFESHPKYLLVLSELNLGKNQAENFEKIITTHAGAQLQGIIKNNIADYSDIKRIIAVLDQIIRTNVGKQVPKHLITLKQESITTKELLLSSILYPSDTYRNQDGIYRIGTFLKYFISKNYNRILSDDLVESFDKYIYSDNGDLTVERLDRLGLKYLLVDLNAATIDKDPRHDLTRRYENLLQTFSNPNLELVETDSICLKLAMEEYKKNQDLNKYMTLAGVNYESYVPDETGNISVIGRHVKQNNCLNEVGTIITNNLASAENYPYLLELQNYILANKANFSTNQQITALLRQYVTHGYFVLFKVK